MFNFLKLQSVLVLVLCFTLVYSCNKDGSAVPPPVPTVKKPVVTFSLSTITSGIDTISDTYIVVRGFLADTGSASITDHGFIVSLDTANLISGQSSTNPNIIKKSLGVKTGVGGFSAKITGLTKGTRYSIASYATNSAGTGYSTDSLVNKIDIKFTTKNPLKIGDIYGGGIVAYLMQPGDTTYDVNVQHGLIVANVNQSNGSAWVKTPNIVICNALRNGLLNGKANTDSIIKYNDSTIVSAASIARGYKGGNYTDWYLPNKDELNKIYLNRIAIGGLDKQYYWTSSEVDNTNTNKFSAWAQDFSNGGQYYGSKAATFYVRAIRAF